MAYSCKQDPALQICVHAANIVGHPVDVPVPAAVGICRAVVLVTSSKTLPIAVTVLSQLSVMLGSGIGLAVVPCVVAHLTQIIWDSLLVSSWVRKDQREQQQQHRHPA